MLIVSNVRGGLPSQTVWTRNDKRAHVHDLGRSGSFDSARTPGRAFAFRRKKRLPNGAYVFRLTVGGEIVATGTVKRACHR